MPQATAYLPRRSMNSKDRAPNRTARTGFGCIALWVAFLVSLPASSATPAIETSLAPMNVVTILVDDMGWADLGCYGSRFHRSPRIDQFARQALRFTQAYAAAPVCTPTRAALLTGKHPARLDMTIWHEAAVDGGRKNERLSEAYSRPNLPLEETSLAELMRERGYATIHVGKWHLGTAAYYPENHGFDVNIGGTFWGAPATFFYPFGGPWSESNPERRYVPGLGMGRPDDYLPDRLTDTAIQLLRENSDRPFMMNLWFYTVHSPIEAPRDRVDHFRSLPPGRFQQSPTYAAMIDRLDNNVGRVLDTLDTLGLAQTTIVIVTSDNGGVDFPVRGITPTHNHPLRSGKGTLYEGGLRIPLLIRWPGRTIEGRACHIPVVSHDLFATLAEGLELAIQEPSPDAKSLLPLLSKPTKRLERDTLFWHYPHYYPRTTPCSAVRSGDWKLIHFYESDACELYDLNGDLGENNDAASTEPAMVGRLRQRLDDWRSHVGANAPIERGRH